MTIAIADRPRFGRRPGHAADAVRAKILALDSGDTRVLESVWVGAGGCEIDHVLINSAGVFTITVHEERSRDIHIDHFSMTVDGLAVPHLRQAKFESEQIARAIGEHVDFDLPVRACVVLLTGSHEPQIHYENRPIGVSVLTKADVPRWFARQPATLLPTRSERPTRSRAAFRSPTSDHKGAIHSRSDRAL